MFNSPEKARINKDEIWERWVNGIESVMAEDKLRAMDVFRRFDADKDSMIGRFDFAEGVIQAGINLNTGEINTLFERLCKSDKPVSHFVSSCTVGSPGCAW